MFPIKSFSITSVLFSRNTETKESESMPVVGELRNRSCVFSDASVGNFPVHARICFALSIVRFKQIHSQVDSWRRKRVSKSVNAVSNNPGSRRPRAVQAIYPFGASK